MNVKRFLSDSYRRSIDHKINRLVLNWQLSKTHKITATDPLPPLDSPDPETPAEASDRPTVTFTHDDVHLIYLAKCSELKLKPTALSEKRFDEQIFNSIGRKSLRFSGLGLGPACAEILINVIFRCLQFVFLDLSVNRLRDEGAHMVANYLEYDPPLISLDLRSNGIGINGSLYLFNALCRNNHLTDLDLSAIGGVERNRIGTPGCQLFAHMLHNNSTLSHINAAYCGITVEGCGFLADALKVNRTLMELDLTANRFRSAGAKALFQHKGSFGNLTTLILSRNGMGDDAAESIARQLKRNMTIKNLDLSDNRFGRLLLSELDRGMSHGTNLETLDLSGNCLENCGDGVASILSNVHSIKYLNLARNRLRSGTIKTIANALENNGTLASIDLTSTMTGNVGAIALADVLQNHPSLQRLYLGDNSITDEGGVPLITALKENTTLALLELGDNELKDETALVLLQFLEKNTTLADIGIAQNDFGFQTYDRLRRAIEARLRTLNSKIEGVANKHIEFLKGEERRLMELRKDIGVSEADYASKASDRDAKADALTSEKETSVVAIANAEKSMAEIQARYDDIVEDRRHKLREFNALKLQLDQRESQATMDLQRQGVVKGQLMARVQRCEAKQLDQRVKIGKTVDDLNARIEELKEQATTVIRDLITAKKLAIEREQMEKAAQLEEEMRLKEETKKKKAPPKPKTKGKPKVVAKAPSRVIPIQQVPETPSEAPPQAEAAPPPAGGGSTTNAPEPVAATAPAGVVPPIEVVEETPAAAAPSAPQPARVLGPPSGRLAPHVEEVSDSGSESDSSEEEDEDEGKPAAKKG
jgi:Ran GTPase-activating protein (RanGAP) involved in mRNA processing and transport